MTKVDKIVQTIRDEIVSGILPQGRRLLSLRRATEEFRVSKTTMVEAYERLSARGLIRSVQGSGFYVSSAESFMVPEPNPPRHVAEAIDMISLLTAQLDQNHAVRIGDGRPPESWMQGAIPSQFPKNLFSKMDGDQSGYGSAYGHSTLREMIAVKHNRDGLPISTDQIVTTFGANHALDLIIRRFLEPGDTVLVDDPGYYPLLAKLKLHKINAIGVPRTMEGTDVDVIRAVARDLKPKIFFTQSTCQNPTGSSYSLACAHAVLQSAMQFGFMVVDNDPFTDLPDQQGVRLASLDHFQSVIAISSFSKLLSASFRVGYLVAARKVAREMTALKMVTTVNSSRFSEMIVADMIVSQRYQKHLKRLKQRIDAARQSYLSRITQLGLKVFDPNERGFYSLLLLPDHIDESQLARNASDKGIFVAPGRLFRTGDYSGPATLRVNVTRSEGPQFYRFLKSEIGA